MSKSRSLLIAFGGVAALVGCRLLVEADGEQCTTDADCAGQPTTLGLTQCVDSVCSKPVTSVDAGSDPDADAAPADPKWGCLGTVKNGTNTTGETIRIRTRLVSVIAEKGIPDIVPKVCKSFDADCVAPLSVGEPTDQDGYLNIDVPKWFDGFIELPPPASYPSMLPSVLFLPPQEFDDDPNKVISVVDSPHIYTIDELKFFLNTIGAPYDPELGHLTGQAQDCQGRGADGVAFATSTAGVSTAKIYLDNQAPSRTLPATTENGIIGFLDLPPGFQTVTYALTDGRRVGSRTLFTRKNSMSLATFLPSP